MKDSMNDRQKNRYNDRQTGIDTNRQIDIDMKRTREREISMIFCALTFNKFSF